MKSIATSLLLLFLFVAQANGQHGSIAYRDLADSLYRHHHYQYAADYYEKALKKSKEPGYLMLQLGKCYDKVNSPVVAEKWFTLAAANKAQFSDEDSYLFAEALIAQQKRSKADSVLERILATNPNAHLARTALSDIRNFEKFFQDSALFKVSGLSINTDVAEFSPVFYKDGLVFSAAKQEGPLRKKYHWDNSNFLNLYYTRKSGNTFTEPTILDKDLNTRNHDGPAMFYDNYQKMILNRNQRVKVEGREDVYELRPGLYDAHYNAGKSTWNVTPLPFNETAYSYAHPSVSEDGNVLYFSSDKPGGYGGTDIYKVERAGGVWGAPFNLGPSVNTIEDEAFPFFVNNTLYFASNGHGGLGGLDIFISNSSPNGFTPPVNPGFPINSSSDDFSLITDSLKTDGYYASARKGSDDIFTFHKLTPKIKLLAHIFDAETKASLPNANIQVITNGAEDLTMNADVDGKFNFSLPSEMAYIIIGTKDDRIGMISDMVDSSRNHEIPAYRDTTRVTCVGLVKDEFGLAVNASVITITDSTTGQRYVHPGNQSIITFRGDKGHRYIIYAEHELGNKAEHTLDIAADDRGTKRFTIILNSTPLNLEMSARVFRADNNDALVNADVKIITFADHDQELTTNSEGMVDFSLGIGTAYVVIATKDGLSGMHSGMAERGTEKSFIIHPVPAYGDHVNTVLGMGLVTSTSGEPVEGYVATVTDKSSGDKITVQANKGVVTFLGKRGASYNISLAHDGFETQLQELHIPDHGEDTEKFAVVLKGQGGREGQVPMDQSPLLAAQNKPSTLILLDTESGGSKAFLVSDEKLREITEKDGQLYVTSGNVNEKLGKGTLAELKTNPSILAGKGIGKVNGPAIRNIYFDFDKSSLDKDDEQRLQQVLLVLGHDASYGLTVAGHADDRGNENYNIRLSKRRSAAVSGYLFDHGISKTRISQKAFGESRPAVTCIGGNCTEDDHQLNRRAEFVLTAPVANTPVMISRADKSKKLDDYRVLLESHGGKEVDGVSFKINIGAYRKKHDLAFAELADLGKIESEKHNGITYYTLIEYQTLQEAENIRQQVQQRGIQGASISIYHHGEKIKLSRFSSLVK